MSILDLDDLTKTLRTFDWQTVINLVPSLTTLNDEQWRMIKGLIIEIATEFSSMKQLVYVGHHHKDFDWPSRNITVELKSATSGTFYKKNGNLRRKFSFKLSNSNGTNMKDSLTEDLICDIILFIKEDGVAYIDRQTAMKNIMKTGDGFVLIVDGCDLIEITGKLKTTKNLNLDFQELIKDTIYKKIKPLFGVIDND